MAMDWRELQTMAQPMLNALDRIGTLTGVLPLDDLRVIRQARVWIQTEITLNRPRVLTLQELLALPEGAVVWEENQYTRDTPMEQLLDTYSQEEDVLQPMMRVNHGENNPQLMNPDGYPVQIREGMFYYPTSGLRMRYWSAMPSQQDREETAWP